LQYDHVKDVNEHRMYRLRLKATSTPVEAAEWNHKFDLFLRASFERTQSYFNPLDHCPDVLVFESPYQSIITAALMSRYIPEEDNLYVCFLSVLPEYRQYGLAKNLLNAIILQAYDNDIKQVTLNVNVENIKAIKLYTKCGFRCTKYIRDYYASNPQPHLDGYYMTLMIKYIRSPPLICKKEKAVLIPSDIEVEYAEQCAKDK
ncbi:unnamed protein product, partial [Didymodactylos carnosus]